MSDIEQSNDAELAATELEVLKTQAAQLGISFHPSISAAKLSAKIAEHVAKGGSTAPEETELPATETPGQIAKRVRDEALALVRVNITCMDPQKIEHDGEIFTVGNSVIPTIRKFVPFNTPDGFHIPKIMYDMLDAKECQVFYSERVNGNNVRKAKQIKAFNIVVLPPLTAAELAELKAAQAASGIIA